MHKHFVFYLAVGLVAYKLLLAMQGGVAFFSLGFMPTNGFKGLFGSPSTNTDPNSVLAKTDTHPYSGIID